VLSRYKLKKPIQVIIKSLIYAVANLIQTYQISSQSDYGNFVQRRFQKYSFEKNVLKI